jgi:hypothetical protein
MASSKKMTRSALSLTISMRVGRGLAGPVYLLDVLGLVGLGLVVMVFTLSTFVVVT